MDTTEARKDFLTGFYTRESLVISINQLRASYETYKKAFSVLLIDVDNFKMFNDKYGHLIGDEVLKYFSSSIRLDLVAEPTTLFRFGGDELVVLFHAADSGEAFNLGNRMLNNLKRRPCNIRGHQLRMSFSGGIAAYPTDGNTAEELLDRADKALYSSKRNGRGQITQYHKIWLKKIRFSVLAVILLFLAITTGFGIRLGFQDEIERGVEQAFIASKMGSQKIAASWTRLRQMQKQLSEAWETQIVSERIPKQNLISSDLESRLARNLEPDVTPRVLRTEKPAKPAPTPPPAAPPAPDAVYLKRGGVIKGRVVARDAEHITVELSSGTGRGSIVLKTEDVEKIEPNK